MPKRASARATPALATDTGELLVHAIVGFDPATLIAIATTLFGLLSNCWKSYTPAMTEAQRAKAAKDYATEEYIPETGMFTDKIMRRCRAATVKACKVKGKRRLKPGEIALVTHAALIKIKNGETSTIMSVMAEAPPDLQVEG